MEAGPFFMIPPAVPSDFRVWWGERANADVAGPLLLVGPFDTAKDAATEAWRRITIVAQVATEWTGESRQAAADWIDRHWPVIHDGTESKRPNVALFPEFIVSERQQIVNKWSATALLALAPPRSGASPAEKVLHKGVAEFPSLRYIGPQMRKANVSNEGPAAPVLQDICRCYAVDLHSQHPTLDITLRQTNWMRSAAEAVELHFSNARTIFLQSAIANFMKVVCRNDPLLFFMWNRRRPQLCTITLRGILERVLRPHIARKQAKRKRAPALGFGIEYDGRLPPCIVSRPGHPMPSAKRVRASVKADEKLVDALARQSPPTAAVATLCKLDRKFNFWIPFCAQCGWRKRPTGGSVRRRTGFVIDVETDEVTCETCNGATRLFNCKDYQIRTSAGWARVCDTCGALTAEFSLCGCGAICKKCFTQARLRLD